MIPVTVSLAWFINQDMLVGINNQIVTAMLGCYNWYAIGSGASYFSQMNPDMFRHLWFMSVLMQFYLLAPLLIYLLRKILVRWVPVAVLADLPCAVRFHGIAVSPGNRSNQSVFRFGHTCHGTLARCHAGMAADDHTAWQRSSGRNGDHGTRSSGLEQDRPAAAFVALLILLWMMQHVEQGPAASMEGFSRLRYFQWFWSPVPFLSDLDAGSAGVQTI
ncbi:MAG: hypothetical protein ACLS6O_08045 [Bifidobacterium sp.]